MRKIMMVAGLLMMMSAGDCLIGYLMAGVGIALVGIAGLKGESNDR